MNTTNRASTSALEFIRVSKTFPGSPPVTALKDFSVQIPAGEVFGVVGESGAGKSTFLDLSVGLEHPTKGEVRVFGTSLHRLSASKLQQLRRSIGVVFQGHHLLSNLTVERNIALPLRLTGKRNDQRVRELLDFVGLSHRGHHYPAELSGGEHQRVAIARALMTQPRIVLFDEPTSALDMSTRLGVLDLIRATQQEFRTTCVLVSHDLDAVKAVCHRAALLERGVLKDIVSIGKHPHHRPSSYLDYARDFLADD